MDSTRPPLPYLDELKLFSKPTTAALPSIEIDTSHPDSEFFSYGIKILGIITLLIICAVIWNYFTSESGRKRMDEWTSQLLMRLYLTDRGELRTIN
jgi:hypothetical protein